MGCDAYMCTMYCVVLCCACGYILQYNPTTCHNNVVIKARVDQLHDYFLFSFGVVIVVFIIWQAGQADRYFKRIKKQLQQQQNQNKQTNAKTSWFCTNVHLCVCMTV